MISGPIFPFIIHNSHFLPAPVYPLLSAIYCLFPPTTYCLKARCNEEISIGKKSPAEPRTRWHWAELGCRAGIRHCGDVGYRTDADPPRRAVRTTCLPPITGTTSLVMFDPHKPIAAGPDSPSFNGSISPVTILFIINSLECQHARIL